MCSAALPLLFNGLLEAVEPYVESKFEGVGDAALGQRCCGGGDTFNEPCRASVGVGSEFV
jgi:hypothetical protein